MRRRLLLLIVLAMFSAAHNQAAHGARQNARQRVPDVEWLFDVLRVDEYGAPHTRVFLVVGGRRVFILQAASQFHVVERERFGAARIPARAITACSGAWAGQGQDLYVLRRNRQLIVYQRDWDEGMTGVPRYRRLRTIPLPR